MAAGGSSKRSSTAPIRAMMLAPSRMPLRRSSRIGPKSSSSALATSTAPSIAIPPSSGVSSRLRPRSFGLSTAPTSRANRAVSGVSSAATAKATRNARSASPSVIA